MTPLTAEQEEALKEGFRKVFYSGLEPRIAIANTEPIATLIDLARGGHCLQDVLFGVPATPSTMKPLIYPLRTYELICELKAKGDN